MTTAYERGWTDYERGKSLRDNAYSAGTVEWSGWRNGWHSHQESLWHDQRTWGEGR